MTTEKKQDPGTRMLFLGEDSLADGFRLIGFETFSNPETTEVDRLLRELLSRGEKAFVVVDDSLMRAEIPGLQAARNEGGRILVTSVPRLGDPPRLAGDVTERLDAMFGRVAGSPS